MIDEDAIRYRWDMVGSKLDERGRRMFAAGEVRTAGRGGLAVVSRITGLAVRPSIAARTISMARNCRKVRYGVPAPAARLSRERSRSRARIEAHPRTGHA